MGNIAEELRQMTPGKAGSTTQLYPMFKTEDGIVLAYSAITASATLTALVDDGVTKFAYGCQVICVHSDAVFWCCHCSEFLQHDDCRHRRVRFCKAKQGD
jgi:hypothetical protein